MGLKMLRSPREIPATIVALAVGVGLTVAAYSLIHAVLLTPLPYNRPEHLVQIWNVTGDDRGSRVLSEFDQAALAASPSPFQAMANYAPARQFLQREPGTAPVELRGALVSANLFDLLGVRAISGRTFEPRDQRVTDTPSIVVSERLIRSGIVTAPLDGLIRLDGTTYRLVGVMPDAFSFPDRETAYWRPLPLITPEMRGSGTAAVSFAFPVVARLANDVTLAAAESQANARLSRPGVPAGVRSVRVDSYAGLLTAPVRPSLLVLQATSVLVLLLVCLNAGWLFAARARRLRPVFATLRALGATPAQVLTTHLVSAACVAMVAAPCAVAIAWLLLRFGLTLESGVFSRTAEPAITWHVATVAFLVTVLASLASSLPGAFSVARANRDLHDRLRAGTRGIRFERSAMTAQVGLVFATGAQGVLVALVLLSLSRTNVGLHKTDFLVVALGVRDSATIDARAQLDRYERLLERLDRRGIRAAASNIFPLTGSDGGSTFEPRRSRDHYRTIVRTRIVTPSYFQLTGLTATAGRLLTESDAGSRHLVVTDAFAATLLRGRGVLGERVGQRGEWTIVGVVPAVRQAAVNEVASPEAYMLYDDFVAGASAASVLRRAYILAEPATGVGAAATLRTIREEVARELPDVEVQSASHVGDLIDLSLAVNRLVAAGSVVFASVALLLAALGLYAMVSHGLARRRREIGIRMALGATTTQIALESVRPLAAVYGAGLCVGIALLLSARSAIHAVMVPPPGVSYPPLSMVAGIAGAVLLATLAVACYRPVKSAAHTDPAVSLRVE